MKTRLAAGGSALALATLALVMVAIMRASTRVPPRTSSGPAQHPQATTSSRTSAEEAPRPGRNVFEYLEGGDGQAPEPAPLPFVRSAPPPLAPSPPSSPIRLVGLVTKAGGQRAALLISGEMAILAPGERSGGYTILSIDEDAGVRVRDKEGVEFSLPVDPASVHQQEDSIQPTPRASPRT